MAEAQGSNIVDEEPTLAKILAIHDDSQNSAEIRELLTEYYNVLDEGDATSPKANAIADRALHWDESTLVFPLALHHSIIELRYLRGGFDLPATKWNIWCQDGINVKPDDDERILAVEKCTHVMGTITFDQPFDRKTVQNILRNRFYVFMFIFE